MSLNEKFSEYVPDIQETAKQALNTMLKNTEITMKKTEIQTNELVIFSKMINHSMQNNAGSNQSLSDTIQNLTNFKLNQISRLAISADRKKIAVVFIKS